MTNGIVLDPFLGSGSTLIAGSSERRSSSATIPLSKQCMEDEMGVSDKITSIAIPLGATGNMEAVSIVLSFMIVFFANACGVEVSTSMMIVILLAQGTEVLDKGVGRGRQHIVVLVIVGAVGAMGGNSTDSPASDSAKPAGTTQQAEEQKEPQEPYECV